ncbi:MAG: YkvA family protein [Pseudomonadota bacterium]
MGQVLEGEILTEDPETGENAAGSKKARADERKVRDKFWKTFRKAADKIPFSEDLVASYYCALDPQTPHRTKMVLISALAYFVLPLDWVPDFILGVGFTDDIAVLTAAIAAIRSSMTPAHYAAARAALDDSDAQKDNPK